MKVSWKSVDPLGEVLQLLRTSGAFYCASELTAPWALDLPPRPGSVTFHLVTRGRCLVELQGEQAPTLERGDLAFVLRGDGHRLASSPGVEPPPQEQLGVKLASERYAVLRHGGGGDRAAVVCGAVQLHDPAARHLVSHLPRVMTVRSGAGPLAQWMRRTVALMAAEAKAMRPGGDAAIARLADVLMIQAIRGWIQDEPAAQPGLILALQDRQLGRAIAGIHREPERAWTVDALAAEAAMSRSAFAERFTQLVGEPAMHYLTRWRMHVALTWLRDEPAGIAELASRLGYQSEAAFSRAFKRHIGVSPGAARRELRAQLS